MANGLGVPVNALDVAGRRLGGAIQAAGALGQLQEFQRQRQLGEQEQARQQRLGGLRRQAVGLGDPEQQQEARLQLISEDPAAAKQFFDAFASLPTPEQDKIRATNQRVSNAAASALTLPDNQLQAGVVAQATQLRAAGFEPAAQRAEQLAAQNLPPEQLRLQLQAAASQGRDIENIIASGEREQARLAKESQSQVDADIKASKDQFEKVDKLRERVSASQKTFKEVEDAKSRIDAVFEVDQAVIDEFKQKAALNNERLGEIEGNVEAFGDMALIFNWMKMLDPGSTVREGEFATAANTSGLKDRVRNLYNRALNGERLTPEQRAGIKVNVNSVFKKAEENNTKRLEKFRITARRNDLPEDEIFGPEEAQVPGTEEAQIPGTENIDITTLSDEELDRLLEGAQ